MSISHCFSPFGKENADIQHFGQKRAAASSPAAPVRVCVGGVKLLPLIVLQNNTSNNDYFVAVACNNTKLS